MTKVIEIKDLTLSYGDKKIFDNLCLDIEQGSFVTLMGPSGSGKTLLTNILLGILPFKGNIKLFGQNLTIKSHNDRVSGVFENSDIQFITDTVRGELIVSLEHLNYHEDDINELIKFISKKFEITHLLDKNPHGLSCGEKQLVALASAIINTPDILILDNALSMIDSYTKTKIYKILKSYQKSGMTIINITSNVEEMLIGTDLVIVNGGKVILNKKVKEALTCEQEFRSAHISLPFMVELCTKLKYYNIVSKIELDKVRLVNAIWK